MSVSVLEAAKHLGRKSNWSLSNLELQKLIYIAHMLHLGRHESPLVDGEFEAWDYGPVHPKLYHEAKAFGASPVANVFRTVPDLKEGTEKEVLNETLNALGEARPAKLIAITHWQEGAWSKRYEPGSKGIKIPNNDILNEYNQRREKKSG